MIEEKHMVAAAVLHVGLAMEKGLSDKLVPVTDLLRERGIIGPHPTVPVEVLTAEGEAWLLKQLNL